MANELLWSGASRLHDWWDSAFLSRFFATLAKHQIIGPCERVEVGLPGRRKKIRIEPELIIQYLFEQPHKPTDRKHFVAGGSSPHAWWVSLVIFPFSSEAGRSAGYNLMKFYTDRAAFDNLEASGRLLAAFTEAHHADDTEAAYIHPYDDWTRLATSAYKPPLVTTPTLAGIFWANFLGPGHLTDFDLEKLRHLAAYRIEWVNDKALFIITSPNVADADSPAAQVQMLKLTETFRQALKSE